MKTLYMKTTDDTVAPYVIFSGDPWRVEVLKQYLDNPKKIAFEREFNTYTGTFKGVPITITSTGIGAPSAAIAMEELYESGMKLALRMGTVMSLDDSLLGQFLVPVASVRHEGLSKTYVDASYPAVADFELVQVLNETIKQYQHTVSNGLNCTMDGFYSQMKTSRLSKERDVDFEALFAELKKNHVVGIDMESSAMMVLGRLMNVKTAVLTAVTVLENLKDSIEGDERKKFEDTLCKIALESIYNYDTKRGSL